MEDRKNMWRQGAKEGMCEMRVTIKKIQDKEWIELGTIEGERNLEGGEESVESLQFVDLRAR